MKNNLIMAASVLMILAGCSKDRLETQTASKSYQFETSIGGVKNTKGLSKEVWKMGDVIALYGLDMATFNLTTAPDKWTFAGSQNAVDNMTPMFYYGTDATDWRYGAPIAWYDGVKTSFIAVYPYKADEYRLITKPSKASDIVVQYTVKGGYDPKTATTDTIAKARNQIKTQTDLLVASTTNIDNTVSTVALNFKHALCQVRFRITNGSSLESSLIRVTDITMNGINSTGKFAFRGTENTSIDSTQWTGQSTPKSFTVNLLSENVNAIPFAGTVDAVDKDDEGLLMIPQVLPDSATISITYSYSNDAGATWIEYKGTKFDPIILKDQKTFWAPNKRYTYQLRIVPAGPVTFVPLVEPWTSVSTTVPAPTLP